MAKKQKYYVVWKGVNPGVYDSWTDCQLQIKGYDGAQYKSFETKEEAEHALASSAFHYIGKNAVKKKDTPKQLPENFDTELPGCGCRLQWKSRTDGISGRLFAYGTGGFSFRSCLWNE